LNRSGRFHVAIAAGAFSIFASAASVPAQVAADAAVQVSATAARLPVPAITLSWPANAQATGFTVYRKAIPSASWGSPIASLPQTATGYQDTNVSVGIPYEYRVSSSTTGGVFANGYLASGIELPLVESRGKVVLVVDGTYASSLATELAQLARDLAGDGWTVLRHDVLRNAAVPSVKALIQADYQADPSNVKAVFLFGHVPVPYSGATNPDGHPDHYGAWPADLYYGDMDGVWTDVQDYSSTVAGRQHNLAGDGKFDQTYAPSSIELQVGRVDLADMPSFSRSELELLRQYLNKDHNFRHRLVTAQRRGLVDDNFGYFSGEAFAASGWRNFSAFFGAANVQALDWFGTLATQSYLWAYGCGGGWYQGAGGVGSTANFAATDTQAVFTMLFGSYFGDWDTTDNFLRAPLATSTWGLTSAWAGRPHWYFHHMGMGEPIGYSARVSQNNSGTYAGGYGPAVHVALMGDPTLRMHVVAPPTALTAGAPSGGTALLQWAPSADPVLGYAVFRAPSPNGSFTRVNAALVTGTFYAAPASGGETWSVRAVLLESGGAGSYYNASQAAFVDTAAPPASFYTLTPCRVIDTRRAAGPLGGPALPASGSRTVVAAASCGIPSDARSISANVTVTGATSDGYLTVYPGGQSIPLASTVNYRAGQTRANNAILTLGSSGDLVVHTGQASGTVHFLVDVTGYFR
jgi:hypothetical protein